MPERKSSPARKTSSGSGRPAARSGASTRSAASRPAGSATSASGGGSRPRKNAAPPPRKSTGGATGRKPGKSIVNQKQTPWGVIAATVAVVLFAAAVVVVVIATHKSSTHTSATSGNQVIPNTPTGSVTKQAAVARVANTSGISGVLAFNTAGYPASGTATKGTLEHQHVTGPVQYSVLPPVGGPHNATWMNAGVYTQPVPSERAVHNLEHGAVWITYDPDLPAAQVAKLRAFVTKQTLIKESAEAEGNSDGGSNRYMDLSPWATNTLPSPIVMSSWGYQLRVTSPTDPRLQQFVNLFRHSKKYSPEYGSAVDGVPVSTGGRPDADGGVANS